jgi:hypothetical protein
MALKNPACYETSVAQRRNLIEKVAIWWNDRLTGIGGWTDRFYRPTDPDRLMVDLIEKVASWWNDRLTGIGGWTDRFYRPTDPDRLMVDLIEKVSNWLMDWLIENRPTSWLTDWLNSWYDWLIDWIVDITSKTDWLLTDPRYLRSLCWWDG